VRLSITDSKVVSEHAGKCRGFAIAASATDGIGATIDVRFTTDNVE